MSTQAQMAANRANAQLSTGPTTKPGKAASCLNNFRHGLAGAFRVRPCEDQGDFDMLLAGLRQDHQPATIVEDALILKMAQHLWLSRRAQIFQDIAMDPEQEHIQSPFKRFELYLRYQTTNDRGFHKCLADLMKLRAEKRQIEKHEAARQRGFESHKRTSAAAARITHSEPETTTEKDEAALCQRAEDSSKDEAALCQRAEDSSKDEAALSQRAEDSSKDEAALYQRAGDSSKDKAALSQRAEDSSFGFESQKPALAPAAAPPSDPRAPRPVSPTLNDDTAQASFTRLAHKMEAQTNARTV